MEVPTERAVPRMEDETTRAISWMATASSTNLEHHEESSLGTDPTNFIARIFPAGMV